MHIATSPWTSEAGASRAVALEVLLNGPISRSEIARRVELSPGSLTRLSTPLIEAGLLVEVGERADGRAGRPSVLLDIIPGSRHFVGMKLTADEVLGAATDLRANVVETYSAQLTSREPTAVADTIADVAARLADALPSVTAIGIGIGGLVSDGRTVRSAPFLQWTDVPLGAMVEERTGLPTVIDNDLVAFTEYEHWFGAARGVADFAVVTLGAGIGFGLVVHDRIVVGEDSGLGLVGHWPLDPLGPLCPSGHRGCAKAILELGSIVAAVSTALGREVGYGEVLALAEAGEPVARRVVDDAGRGLGLLLAAIANLTVPRLIVLGGEGVGLVDVAGPAIAEGIRTHRDEGASGLRLHSTDGDDIEWCRGAAVLAIQRYVLGT